MTDIPITDRICNARMETSHEALQAIRENTEEIKESLKQLPSLCEQVKVHSQRIESLELWKGGLFKAFLWFTGTVLTMTATALIIYEKIRK